MSVTLLLPGVALSGSTWRDAYRRVEPGRTVRVDVVVPVANRVDPVGQGARFQRAPFRFRRLRATTLLVRELRDRPRELEEYLTVHLPFLDAFPAGDAARAPLVGDEPETTTRQLRRRPRDDHPLKMPHIPNEVMRR